MVACIIVHSIRANLTLGAVPWHMQRKPRCELYIGIYTLKTPKHKGMKPTTRDRRGTKIMQGLPQHLYLRFGLFFNQLHPPSFFMFFPDHVFVFVPFDYMDRTYIKAYPWKTPSRSFPMQPTRKVGEPSQRTMQRLPLTALFAMHLTKQFNVVICSHFQLIIKVKLFHRSTKISLMFVIYHSLLFVEPRH